jgi:FKBP-type peptidyl-prolyl cis-trans isomerase
MKRAGWILLAVLFVVTGLGVGLVAFWQSTHPANPSSPSSSTTKAPVCSNNPSIQLNTEPAKSKLAGAKLSDFTPVAHVPSLSCIDVKLGSTGQAVQSSSTIIANYTGALASTGVIFQSSLDNNGQPFSTALSGVIPGWQQGLLGMRAGGERRLLIPASLAYGSQAQSGIPANSDLVFDITVLEVQ